MPSPLSICLEDLNTPADPARYLRCVALPGNLPGLALTNHAQVVWQQSGPEACQLWVSADDRLILFRPAGAIPVTVRRGPRSLEAPVEKPVVILDQDRIETGRRALRVHIHGVTDEVHPPTPIAVELLHRSVKMAAVLAFGAASISCHGDPPRATSADAAAGALAGSTRTEPGPPSPEVPPPAAIEVRMESPKPVDTSRERTTPKPPPVDGGAPARK